MLKAYELVPEAYHQTFCTWKRMEKQMHLDFARDLVTLNIGVQVEKFEDLPELIMLEQFRNSIPSSIVQHINDLSLTSQQWA